MEGPSSSAKDITFKAPLNLYSSRARSVTIYLKYYTNSQRRLSLYPVRESGGSGSSSPAAGSLQLLPLSATPSVSWTEIRREIDPSDSPVEITAHLASKEFLIFDKIVVAVDTPLPSDLSISCSVMRNPPVFGAGGGSTISSPVTTRSIPTTPQQQQCPPIPPVPECKCNCSCNCAKC